MNYRKCPKRVNPSVSSKHALCLMDESSSRIFLKDFRNRGKIFNLSWNGMGESAFINGKVSRYDDDLRKSSHRRSPLSLYSKICIATEIFGAKSMRAARRGLLHSPHAAETTTRQLVDPTRPYLSCHRSRAKAHSGASTHDVHPERERESRNNPTLLTNFLREGEDSKNVKTFWTSCMEAHFCRKKCGVASYKRLSSIVLHNLCTLMREEIAELSLRDEQ